MVGLRGHRVALSAGQPPHGMRSQTASTGPWATSGRPRSGMAGLSLSVTNSRTWSAKKQYLGGTCMQPGWKLKEIAMEIRYDLRPLFFDKRGEIAGAISAEYPALTVKEDMVLFQHPGRKAEGSVSAIRSILTVQEPPEDAITWFGSAAERLAMASANVLSLDVVRRVGCIATVTPEGEAFSRTLRKRLEAMTTVRFERYEAHPARIQLRFTIDSRLTGFLIIDSGAPQAQLDVFMVNTEPSATQVVVAKQLELLRADMDAWLGGLS